MVKRQRFTEHGLNQGNKDFEGAQSNVQYLNEKVNGGACHSLGNKAMKDIDQNNLKAVLDGDLSQMDMVIQQPYEKVVALSRRLPELVVTSKSIVRVLTALKERTVTAQDVQAWASFVRRGYVAGMTNQPVKPLTIEYEQLYEDAIVEIIDRLDQLGDLIDGTIDETMLDTMIAKVSRPTVR